MLTLALANVGGYDGQSTAANPKPAGQIAFSFDDAPWGQGGILTGPERTDSLIKKLADLKIDQVVFFCVTARLGYHQGHQRLERYAAAGHLLGNHTHSHVRPSDHEAGGYIADVKEAHDSLQQFPTFVPWFRYPWLDEGRTSQARDNIRAALDSLGYRNGYVTVDTWDWYLAQRFRLARREGKSIDLEKLGNLYVEMVWRAIVFYDSLAREILHRSPKHVLLLHENDLAALYIDNLVQRIRSHGWQIISPSEAYRDSLAVYIPDVLENNQGRIVAIAKERGYRGLTRHESENAEYIDSIIIAKGIFGR